jgi:hypothetical protein
LFFYSSSHSFPGPGPFFYEKTDHQKNAAYYHTAVGHIEGRKTFHAEESVEPEIQEINHPFGAKNPIQDISHTAAENAGDSPALNPGEGPILEIIDKKNHQYRQGQDDKEKFSNKFRPAVSKTEGYSQIPDMDNPEKVIPDPPAHRIHGDGSNNGPFGKLIKADNPRRQKKGYGFIKMVSSSHSFS